MNYEEIEERVRVLLERARTCPISLDKRAPFHGFLVEPKVLFDFEMFVMDLKNAQLSKKEAPDG